MTLWFDVSDLCIWTEPQLTGIQRTVLSVLTELRRVRDDVRLFRCFSGRLSTIDHCELPWRWTDDGPLRRKVQEYRPSWDQRAGSIVRRYAGENIATLLALARDLSARLPRLPRLGSALSAPRRSCPLFAAGDICLSLSATWQFPRYGQLVASQKALAPVGCINLLYDLVPHLFPEWAGSYHARRFTVWAQRQIENADLVLAISDFQKSEIERFFRRHQLPPKPVATIRLGDNHKLEAAQMQHAPRYIPGKPFVLCVSTIDVRKNPSCLYRVWRRLTADLGENCPQLLLVGMAHASGTPVLRLLRSDPLVNRLIVHLADVSDAELAWYYSHSLFTIYPSLYEGWGLPVGESLAAGRYCISSNASSLPEIGGDLVDYFDPTDELTCFNLVRRAILQPDYVKQRERDIRDRFRSHSWAATALQISSLANQAREQLSWA
jgi:glycosyltransferase involved in cell wall biosynthesis